jgi:hypothetical protein
MLNLYDNMIIDANSIQEKFGRKYYKHIGEFKADSTQVVILFRTVPGEAHHCLVVGLKFLSDVYRDSLISSLQSTDGQSSFEFGTYLSKQKFPDGVDMLNSSCLVKYTLEPELALTARYMPLHVDPEADVLPMNTRTSSLLLIKALSDNLDVIAVPEDKGISLTEDTQSTPRTLYSWKSCLCQSNSSS